MSKSSIEHAFFRWGWLVPAFLPLAQVVGRAVFSILGAIYFIWAMFCLWGKRIEFDRPIVMLYLLLLAAYLLSVPGAADSLHALREWFKFMVYSMSFLVTYAVLQLVPNGIERLLKAFAAGAVVILVVLYLSFAYQYQQAGFNPNLHMREDNLPFLMPFLIFFVASKQWPNRIVRRCLVGAAVVALFTYVIVSQGRAALFALLVGLLAYAYFVGGMRLRAALAVVTLALVIGVFGVSDKFLRRLDADMTAVETLDAVSSYRTVLWRQALRSPPPNILVGVGMGNIGNQDAVMPIALPGGVIARVKHLHNFLLDSWYETGLIGLTALLLWLGGLIWRGVKVWRSHETVVRLQAGVLLAASLAIMSNALLSYSYTSKPFAIYLSIFFGALAFLSAPHPPTSNAQAR